MVADAFRVDRRPFRSAPSAEAFVLVPPPVAALATLAAAIRADEGLFLLHGDSGVGKTTVALALLRSLADRHTPVYLPTARLQSPTELYQAILFDCARPYQGFSEQELRLAVTEQLLDFCAAGKSALIVLDEAHALGDGALAELFHFDNLQHHGRRAAAVLLVGRSSLRERLRGTSLQQRVAVAVHLETLSTEDSGNYLRHQARGFAFTHEAIDILAAHGEGNARLLNRLASQALAFAHDTGHGLIDAEAALAAVEFHRPSAPAQPAQLHWPDESITDSDDSTAEAGQPAAALQPKQKARKRKAA